MRYCKILKDGYILGVGIGDGGVEISEKKYNEILSIIAEHPTGTATTAYRLRDDLTWEEYTPEPAPEPEPEDSDKAEAYDILMGVTE